MNTLVWASASWREQAVVWLDERLAAGGISRTGAVEQPHLRPWATALTAPTTAGPVWLKAAGPGTAFEAGLYELLARVVPEQVLVPIAVDAARGWMLLPDGGPPLADRVAGAALADAFVAILPEYGRLQRALAPEIGTALAAGVSDMRAQAMPGRFDEAVESVTRGDADASAALRDVLALRDTYASWCERLAVAPVPASLDHNDLHPWNMLVSRLDHLHEVRFYDWGDTVVAHPFASMLVPLNWAQRRLELDLDAPELHRIRDAYLDVFSDLAPHAELVETLELACRVGKVARALTWARALAASDPGEIDDSFASAPLECLLSLLEDTYLVDA
jgi:Phosphotransferase enzyme family